MILQGKAIDNITLADFLTRMENSKYFTEINLEQSRSAKEGAVELFDFKVNGTVSLPK
jgi:hypothetical protein